MRPTVEWVTTTLMLEHLLQSDEEAWGEFVDRFRAPLVAFAAKLGLGDADAEDVAQETLADFHRAYQDGQYDRQRGRLRSWLFGIAHRRVKNAIRKRAEQENKGAAGMRTGFWDELPDDQALEQTWDATWKLAVYEQCMRQVQAEVDPVTFEAFEAHAIHRQPVEQVVKQTGLTRNAVYLAKHRVLKRLTELSKQYEGEA